MHKNHNILSTFFSLLTKHINNVQRFSNQTAVWLAEGNDIYYEALTNYLFNQKLLSSSRRIIVTVEEINNLNVVYVYKLRLLADILALLRKEMVG